MITTAARAQTPPAPRPDPGTTPAAAGDAQGSKRADPSGARPAVVKDPETIKQARAHFERGAAAYKSGQLKQAIEHFKRAYQLAPSAELDFDLAHVYERIGEAGEAIDHYRSYAKRAPLADAERSDIERRVQNLIALQARQRAPLIERAPAREALAAEAQAFFQRGTKLYRQGKYEAALIAFTEAQRFAKLPELDYNMAVINERLNRAPEAIEYYRAYLRDADHPSDAERVQARIRALTPK